MNINDYEKAMDKTNGQRWSYVPKETKADVKRDQIRR